MAAHLSPLISMRATQFQRGLIFQRTAHSFRTRAGAACMMRSAVSLKERRMTGVKESVVSIVLVHGGFVDGSGWQGVYETLRQDGFRVSVVQNPTMSLADDVAVTLRSVVAQAMPVLLVGHSYGGVVITEAGNSPNV